jgi:DNA-binding GntR family transcriptional regulator
MRSQADRAYDLIKAKIVVLDIPPGAILDEEQLAQELKFGRLPIREALQRLERDGLVVIQPWRSTYVSEVKLLDLRNICEARLSVESWSARLAAERISPSELYRLQKSFLHSTKGFGHNSTTQLIDEELNVHKTIAEASGNKYLLDFISPLLDLSARIWRMLPNPQACANEIAEHHQQLYQALQHRDAVTAEKIVRSDIICFWDFVRAQI